MDLILKNHLTNLLQFRNKQFFSSPEPDTDMNLSLDPSQQIMTCVVFNLKS